MLRLCLSVMRVVGGWLRCHRGVSWLTAMVVVRHRRGYCSILEVLAVPRWQRQRRMVNEVGKETWTVVRLIFTGQKRKGKKKRRRTVGRQDLATATAMTKRRDEAGRETAEGHRKSSPSWKDVLRHAGRRRGEGEGVRRGVGEWEWESEKGKEQH
ncbi:hypothetical protein EI94DRAFT_1707824 [Lactarius quietus]|nr:hypothetical protein EI94DRAFT_1707824 [Lactarius quietus]